MIFLNVSDDHCSGECTKFTKIKAPNNSCSYCGVTGTSMKTKSIYSKSLTGEGEHIPHNVRNLLKLNNHLSFTQVQHIMLMTIAKKSRMMKKIMNKEETPTRPETNWKREKVQENSFTHEQDDVCVGQETNLQCRQAERRSDSLVFPLQLRWTRSPAEPQHLQDNPATFEGGRIWTL